MDITETTEPIVPAEPRGLLLLEDAQSFLHQSGRWATFLGILGFIGSALMALLGLFFGTLYSALSVYQQSPMPAFFGSAMGVVYLVMAVFNFFIALYLYQFGVGIKRGIAIGDTVQVTHGLGKLKSLFKLAGITTIVIMSLYALVIIVMIIAAIIGVSLIKH
jgi:hypothetical protein